MSFLDSADDPKRAGRRPLYSFLLASLAVGAAASLFTEPNLATWYAGLVASPFHAAQLAVRRRSGPRSMC